MSSEQKLDELERQLLSNRSGYREDSSQYADITARLNKIERVRKIIEGKREGKDKWTMFWISQIIPFIAIEGSRGQNT
jgi:hypothetical protein